MIAIILRAVKQYFRMSPVAEKYLAGSVDRADFEHREKTLKIRGLL
jgi:hypothetical protein